MLTYEERIQILKDVDTMLDGVLAKVGILTTEEEMTKKYSFPMQNYFEHLNCMSSGYSSMKYNLTLAIDDLALAHIHNLED